MTDMTSYDAPPRTVSTADRVITVVLMLALAVLVPVAGVLGLLTVMASDSCGSSTECNTGQLGLGVFVSTLAPAAVFVATVVWVVVRWRRDRPTWWLPLIGAVAGAVVWVLGAVITFTAVG